MLFSLLCRCRAFRPPTQRFFTTSSFVASRKPNPWRRTHKRSPIRNAEDETRQKEELAVQKLNNAPGLDALHAQLTEASEAIPLPRLLGVFENVIGHLVDNGRFHQAVTIYQRLRKKGLTPSPSTDADILLVSLALGSGDNEELIQALMLAVSSPSYTEPHFRRTLLVMARLHLPYPLIIDTIHTYLKTRLEPPSATLVSDLVDAAIYTVDTYNQIPGQKSDARVYAAAIDAYVRENRNGSGEGSDVILRTMSDHGVHPDFRVFNALIRRQIRLKNWEAVFAIYDVMIESAKTVKILPDTRTFVMLFHAHEELHFEQRGGYKLLAVPRSAREIYYDMLATLFNERMPRPATAFVPSVLPDYAAAYVALATFDQLKIPSLSARLFIDMNRPQWWTGKKGNRLQSSWWAFIQLGLTSVQESLGHISLGATYGTTARFTSTTLLVVVESRGLRSQYTRDSSPYPSLGRAFWKETMVYSRQAQLTVLPLLRLMKRALLASFGDDPNVEQLEEFRSMGTRKVSASLVEARKEMVPKGQNYYIPMTDGRPYDGENSLLEPTKK
ncbi:hypothetical protein DL96DRAFT_1571569 [Flagelloscypha sp. PMI_526]|nr:hypothetical protein DL96DRAFT_1571569 [Flagelloscypha sp. PMI_526]